MFPDLRDRPCRDRHHQTVAPSSYADPHTNLCADGDQHHYPNLDAYGLSHRHGDSHRNGSADGDTY
jgi:hypothetical protein